MRILALDTTTETGSCALWLAGESLQRICPVGRPHSETLLPLVRELLAEAGLRLAQLDGIAFGAGPGAFTGLRIACGAAQGLALGADRPVVPVVSLASLVEAEIADRALAILDARMNEVYAAQYERQAGVWTRVSEIRVSAPEAVELPSGDDWIVCGNALAAYPALNARLIECGVRRLPPAVPMAAQTAAIGARLVAAGEAIDPADAAPLYIRDKVAQTIAERLQTGGKA